MRWKFVPGDPDSETVDGDQDRIVIDGLEGEETPLACIGEIGLFYADNNIRHGYDVDLKGSCAKGPQGINWGPITITFEDAAAPTPDAVSTLRTHLNRIWGPEGEILRVERTPETAAAAVGWL